MDKLIELLNRLDPDATYEDAGNWEVRKIDGDDNPLVPMPLAEGELFCIIAKAQTDDNMKEAIEYLRGRLIMYFQRLMEATVKGDNNEPATQVPE